MQTNIASKEKAQSQLYRYTSIIKHFCALVCNEVQKDFNYENLLFKSIAKKVIANRHDCSSFELSYTNYLEEDIFNFFCVFDTIQDKSYTIKITIPFDVKISNIETKLKLD